MGEGQRNHNRGYLKLGNNEGLKTRRWECKSSIYSSTDKPFPGFLWTELNQRGPSKEKSKHVSHDIVNDDHHDGHDEPDETLKHVLKWANKSR